ncbi:MAG: YjjG family noncanonical pyrimidine nucleotidase [Chitinophagaceae bacterium]
MNTIYKYLFLDFDRTFWDVDTNQYNAQKNIFDTFNLRQYFDNFETYYNTFREKNEQLWEGYRDGKISREYLRNYRFEYLLEKAHIPNKIMALEMSNYYLKITPNYNQLLPYSKEILEYLFPKYPMYLLTNGFNEVQFDKIEKSGLTSYFQKVITSEMAEANKPSPQIFNYAIKQTKVEKEKTIMIGDDISSDILGSLQINMDCIFLNTHKIKHTQQPTFEIYHLKEIEQIL